ncbi:hypothetical protein B0H34DRAFT_679948 [Crassisporium funariophilum]|nr:hypothetical protein B0H34DRAFT_679948 [Crassisporium funariophilum]
MTYDPPTQAVSKRPLSFSHLAFAVASGVYATQLKWRSGELHVPYRCARLEEQRCREVLCNVLPVTEARVVAGYALFAVTLTTVLNVLIFIFFLLDFAVLDVRGHGWLLGCAGGCIHYLIQYSSMPGFTHWLTNAQTHITASSVLAFFFSHLHARPLQGAAARMPRHEYESLLRDTALPTLAPHGWRLMGSALCHIQLYSDDRGVGGILLRHQGVRRTPSVQSGRTWRHVNAAEVNEPEGGVSLP